VRLFVPDDVHLTVAFLGPVGDKAAEAAFELAREWPSGPLEATLGEVRPMGNPRRPSAFSAIVTDGAGALTSAILRVRDGMLERADARSDDRPPLPHVTIARPPRRASRETLKAAVAWAGGVDLARPRVSLSQLVLYTHSQNRQTRLFREHATFSL
jgi:2'-5' RNA ligase